jgi:hypothetical protein
MSSLAWIALSIAAIYLPHPGRGHMAEDVRYQCTMQRYQRASGKNSAALSESQKIRKSDTGVRDN